MPAGEAVGRAERRVWHHPTMDRTTLLDAYRTGYDDVVEALDGITDEELDRAQPGEDWTVRQIVHHLADGEARSYVRIRRLVAEDEPLILDYDEPEYARRLHYDRPIEPSLEVLRTVRASTLQLLEAMSPGEFARTGTHSVGGPYSVMRWLEIYAAHPHDHADQIRRARHGAG